jgi:hypothetical protein
MIDGGPRGDVNDDGRDEFRRFGEGVCLAGGPAEVKSRRRHLPAHKPGPERIVD